MRKMLYLYEIRNKAELNLLKNSLRDLASNIKRKEADYYKSKEKYFKEDWDVNSFEDAGNLYYTRLLEPLALQSKVVKYAIGCRWVSFVHPYGVSPWDNFDFFYHRIVEYLFVEWIIYNHTVKHEQLLRELDIFFINTYVHKKREIQYNANVPVKELIAKHGVDTGDIFVNLIVANVKEFFDDSNEVKDYTIKYLFFDKLRDNFIDNINDKNINFKDAEHSFQGFFEILDKKSLLAIDYNSFRTKLAIDNDELPPDFQDFITISIQNNNMTLEQVGELFYHLWSTKFKGNKKAFITWVKKHFIWVKKDGKAASMTFNSLSKKIKKR